LRPSANCTPKRRTWSGQRVVFEVGAVPQVRELPLLSTERLCRYRLRVNEHRRDRLDVGHGQRRLRRCAMIRWTGAMPERTLWGARARPAGSSPRLGRHLQERGRRFEEAMVLPSCVMGCPLGTLAKLVL
jgi:hypothetical protein